MEFYKDKTVLISLGVFLLIVCVLFYFSFFSGVDQYRLQSFFVGIGALGVFLTVAALIAAFDQVRAARRQISESKRQLQDNRNWNRMSFALTYLPSIEVTHSWERELNESFLKIIDRCDPLTENEVNQILEPDNHEIRVTLKNYLNSLEAYCLAINKGLADEDTAKRFYSHKIVRHYIELHPYIEKQRNMLHEPRLYMEMKSVYDKWRADNDPIIDRYGDD